MCCITFRAYYPAHTQQYGLDAYYGGSAHQEITLGGDADCMTVLSVTIMTHWIHSITAVLCSAYYTVIK
jgi:hypothetical protein